MYFSLDAVIASDCPGVIRRAAQKLKDHNGYLDVGTYLKELSQPDINQLAEYCTALVVEKDSGSCMDYMCLLAELLANGEGISQDGIDPSRLANLIIMITFEDLARKGVVEIDYSKVTLSSDVTDANVVKLK